MLDEYEASLQPSQAAPTREGTAAAGALTAADVARRAIEVARRGAPPARAAVSTATSLLAQGLAHASSFAQAQAQQLAHAHLSGKQPPKKEESYNDIL